jgi:uncharacterized protein YegJ (DUF2314 family)
VLKRKFVFALLFFGFIAVVKIVTEGIDSGDGPGSTRPAATEAWEERNTIMTRDDDDTMNAAMDHARETLPRFRELMAEHPAGTLAVNLKKRFEDGEQVEHIWLTDVSVTEDGFAGMVNNQPMLVHNTAMGERVNVAPDEVSDWMVVTDDSTFYGAYTVRVLIDGMSPRQLMEQGLPPNTHFAE